MFLAVFRNDKNAVADPCEGMSQMITPFSFFSAIPRLRHESFDRKDQMIRINEKNDGNKIQLFEVLHYHVHYLLDQKTIASQHLNNPKPLLTIHFPNPFP
jgi:Zn-dependent peptidase ImmA (M78 family)